MLDYHWIPYASFIAFLRPELTVSLTWNWPAELESRADLTCANNQTVVSIAGQQMHFSDTCFCCCQARAVWQTNVSPALRLYIEYVDTAGHSNILSKFSNTSSFPYTMIHHTGGPMTELPYNIHNFKDNLVLLELPYNKISTLDRLSGLNHVDTLNLTGNQLSELPHGTFNGMLNLRILDLSNNEILTMAPGLIADIGTLMNVNLAGNLLTKLDGSDVIINHPFCEISFQNNRIEEITNKLNNTLNETNRYGPGYVGFQGNNFQSFFDFEKLGVTDLSQIGLLLSLNLDISSINWTCDCQMVPFLKLTSFTLKGGWMGSDDIKCQKPENLRGLSIKGLVKTGDLDLFNCSLSDNCPDMCTCIDQPSQDRLIVNCNGTHTLTSLPETLPKSISNKIELYMSGNSIQTLNKTSYLERVTVLDISNNTITTFTDSAAASMTNISKLLLLNNPVLHKLPASLKDINPNYLVLGSLTIDCNCDTEWIGEWIRVKGNNASNVSNVVCRTADRVVPAKDFRIEDLDCIPESLYNLWLGLIIGSVSIVSLILGTVAVILRFEIMLIFLKTRPQSSNDVHPSHENDVYLSFDEENDYLYQWVFENLFPVLETSGYQVFLPSRHLLPGAPKQDAILDAIATSKSFIAIVSEHQEHHDGFSAEPEAEVQWHDLEWQYAWSMYKKNNSRKIILINFDRIAAADVKRKTQRAYLRLGLYLDISDMDRLFYKHLKEKLGRPKSKPEGDNSYKETVDLVTKPTFRPVVQTEVLI